MFDFETQGDVIIVTPQRDLREFEFGEIEIHGAELMDLLEREHARNVVIDFYKTDYYGSTALSFFVKLWKRIRAHNGKMVFCNVSDHEHEILELTKLDTLWGLSGSREDALRDVQDD
jgi:anti-anti-sigma factor